MLAQNQGKFSENFLAKQILMDFCAFLCRGERSDQNVATVDLEHDLEVGLKSTARQIHPHLEMLPEKPAE